MTIGFWLIAVLLLGIALLFLLPPLLRQGRFKTAVARDQINISVYRDQLAELESDVKNGTISQEHHDLARADLERGLLADVAAADETPEAQEAQEAERRSLGRVTAAVVAVVIPVVAVALYQIIGGGSAAFTPDKATPMVAAAEHNETIEGMMEKLIARLEQEPNDIDGWFMLGRSYQFLKRYDEAKAAFERVIALGGGSNPDFLATYADVLAMLNNRRISGESAEMLKRALAINPLHVKSLWLAGTAAYQDGDYQNALQYWERLAGTLPPGSEDEQTMRNNIAEVRSLIGLPSVATPPKATAAVDAGVRGTVALDKAVAAKVSPSDTVFIFARAADGPRMPLAIVRKQVKDLPFDFALDDSMAMNPMMKLSDFAKVVVGARVSKTGNAMPQPGDFEGYSDTIKVGAAGATRVVIGRMVQ